MDPQDDLRRVPRPSPSVAWIGAWVAGLGAVVIIALLGSQSAAPAPPSGPPAGIVTAAPSSAPTPSPSPTPWDGIPAFRGGSTPTPTLAPSRPPLGEDGLIGGSVFGTNWPPPDR